MQVQQLEVKLFVEGDDAFDQEKLIPIFHRWIQQNRLGDFLLIDIADYRHVPDGPGLMLVGHGVQWKLDSDRGELGFVFARKRDTIGDAMDKLADAHANLLTAVEALEAEPTLAGALRFSRLRGQVTVMSRLVASNDDADYEALAPIVREYFAARNQGRDVSMSRPSDDPREPLTIRFTIE